MRGTRYKGTCKFLDGHPLERNRRVGLHPHPPWQNPLEDGEDSQTERREDTDGRETGVPEGDPVSKRLRMTPSTRRRVSLDVKVFP